MRVGQSRIAKLRSFFVLMTALLMASASHLRAAGSSDATIEDLVAKLKSPNAAPVIDKRGMWRASFPDSYNVSAQARVLDAWKELHSRFEEALPVLVEHVSDEDYCVTIELGSSGAQRNRSVGEVCEYLIRLNVEPYCRPLFRNPIHQPFLLSFDNRERREFPVAIENWWAKRKSKSLAKLQLEAVDWQIQNYDPAETFEFGRIPKSRIDSELQELKDMKTSLEERGRLSEPPQWRSPDEFLILKAKP